METQLDNAQVTRLLEIAAAMSSAQEKVTGSGKLDLSGVMAALAMANKQEGGNMVNMANKQEGGRTGFGKQSEKGRQSFLHGGWRPEEGKPENRRLNSSSEVSQQAVRSSEGLAQFLNGLKGEKQQRSSDDPPSRQPSPPPIEPNLNLAVNHVAHDANNQQANNSFLHNLRKESLKSYGVQETNRSSSDNPKPMCNSGRLADRKAIFESSSSSSSSSSSISSSCSNSSSPDTGKRTFSLPSRPSPTGPSSSRPSPTGPSSAQQQKTFAPPRATEPAQYGAQSLVEETGGLGRLADRKAKFEMQHNSSSVVGGINHQQPARPAPPTNIPVATVFERKASKAGEIQVQGSQGQLEDDEGSLTSLLDSRDSQVAQFLEVVTAMAGERAKKTGDGRLDMGGLLEALAAVEGIQVQEKETKEVNDKTQSRSLAPRSKAQPSRKPETMLGEEGKVQGLSGAGVEEGGEQVRQSWQEALRGARRPQGLRGQSEEVARSVRLRGHSEEVAGAGEVKDVEEGRRAGLRGDGTVLAQPAMATLTPTPPPLPPRDLPQSRGSGAPPALPSSAPPPPVLQRPSQMMRGGGSTAQPFVEEKSSVIGELKNMLEDGGCNRGTLGRSGSSGFKLPPPQDPVDTSNPQDPTVKRIVYNQYREMLKSYRTAQT